MMLRTMIDNLINDPSLRLELETLVLLQAAKVAEDTGKLPTYDELEQLRESIERGEPS